eukprot:gene1621-biopygen9388
MSEGPRRSSGRYPGGPGRCQMVSAVAVTDIQGAPGRVSGDPPGVTDMRGSRTMSEVYGERGKGVAYHLIL